MRVLAGGPWSFDRALLVLDEPLEQLSELCEIELGATGDYLGKYLCVRIRVDVLKPLQYGIQLDMWLGEKIFLLLHMESYYNIVFFVGS
ncbi:hypothetical protein JRO89_XS14G0044700 [Xanthoceras sorbifolium]|uniref:DUF4283 domain-containing protein n=1 Tax=Xanthoceras sorbifolium TaxID=99658 RepID=A0ABQ8H3T8_9ROSI|nr:hypothetical protein JRO89_XS14G0044700 [Xanthoceras sorbifolium]